MSRATVSSATRTETVSRSSNRLRVDLAPVPASRPRTTRYGTYYVGPYKRWRIAAEETIPEAASPLEGNLDVTLDLVCHKPKTTKRDNPRGDIDNYIKAVLDALTKKGYWNDDDQIVYIRAEKRWPNDNEESHFTVWINQV